MKNIGEGVGRINPIIISLGVKITRFLLSKIEDRERIKELAQNVKKYPREIEDNENRSKVLSKHPVRLKLLGIIRPLIRSTQRVKGLDTSTLLEKVDIPLFDTNKDNTQNKGGGKD